MSQGPELEHLATIGYALSLTREAGDCLVLNNPGEAMERLRMLSKYLLDRSVELRKSSPGVVDPMRLGIENHGTSEPDPE